MIGQVLDYQKWLEQSSVGYLVKPFTARGIGGFVFSIKDEDRLELRADITDYVTEDNRSVQAHIAIKPMVLTLRGFVGEVRQTEDPGLAGIVGAIETRLTAVAAYAPELASGAAKVFESLIAKQPRSTLEAMDDFIKSTQNLASAFDQTLPGQTEQERALVALASMFKTRQVMTVETPWGYFDNMAIQNIVCEQDGKTRQVSDIAVTLKQLQFSDVMVRPATSAEIRMLQEIGFYPKKLEKGKEISSLDKPWANAMASETIDALDYMIS